MTSFKMNMFKCYGSMIYFWDMNALWQPRRHDDVIKWKHFSRCWPFVGQFIGEFPAQKPVTRSFGVFFHLCLNKRLSKQSWCRNGNGMCLNNKHDDVIKRNNFPVTGPLCWEFTGHRWIPRTKPVTRSFDVFLGLRLNKRLSKQSRGWWFETPSHPSWRRRNERALLLLGVGKQITWIQKLFAAFYMKSFISSIWNACMTVQFTNLSGILIHGIRTGQPMYLASGLKYCHLHKVTEPM